MNVNAKKFLQFCVMTCFLISCTITIAYAKSGDVIGKVYSSDILAVVNGYPIASYNIGGKTVVSADELQDYGFFVWYNNESRRLSVTTSYNRVTEETLDTNISRGKTGNISGTLYETDIITTVNGIETTSYAIDGKICICIEELGDLTDSINAQYGYSKYYMNCKWDAENRIISLNALFDNTGEFTNSKISKNGYGLYITAPKNPLEGFVEFEDTSYSSGSISASYYHYQVDKMIPLRLRYEGEDTDFIVGYMFICNESTKFHLFIDVLEQAFDEGYYHVVTHDERIEYINNHYRINSEQPYERFDADICTVIYFEQHGLPRGGSSYNLTVIYMDGSFKRITNLPLKDIALSDGGTKLTYVSIMNGRTYEVDLATAEVSEKE